MDPDILKISFICTRNIYTDVKLFKGYIVMSIINRNRLMWMGLNVIALTLVAILNI